jgi:hypothetical protein
LVAERGVDRFPPTCFGVGEAQIEAIEFRVLRSVALTLLLFRGICRHQACGYGDTDQSWLNDCRHRGSQRAVASHCAFSTRKSTIELDNIRRPILCSSFPPVCDLAMPMAEARSNRLDAVMLDTKFSECCHFSEVIISDKNIV